MASNSLLAGGAPLVYDGTHPSGFRARMTSVRALLARDGVSVARNHFCSGGKRRTLTCGPASLSRDGALPDS